jgi:hypothetical protein
MNKIQAIKTPTTPGERLIAIFPSPHEKQA